MKVSDCPDSSLTKPEHVRENPEIRPLKWMITGEVILAVAQELQANPISARITNSGFHRP